jgi:hypothetical protein
MPDEKNPKKPRNIGLPPGLFIAMREAIRAVQRDTRREDRQLTDATRDLVDAASDAMDRFQDARIMGGSA